MNIDTSEFLTRQSDLISSSQLRAYPITIIGAGAIGGWVALSLVKMGITNITVYDFDIVDTVNMNCQFYRVSDIGRPKVEALRELIEDFTGIVINIYNEKYTGQPIQGICISAVDSMAVRKLAYMNSLRMNYIIDPRMAVEDALMYVMNPSDRVDRESYEKTLYSDEESVHERCTSKATIYTANLLAGMVVKAVKDLITFSSYPRITMWDIKSSHLIVTNKERSSGL
jgi:molybdopterin/thiamine biosynthesis adenylyltransferase